MGRDSRHLLLELVAAGRPPTDRVTVRNFAPRADADVEIAGDVARKLGVAG